MESTSCKVIVQVEGKITYNNCMQRNFGSDGELANEGFYKPKSADTQR